MSSFLCFVCHSTVNADTNEETRDKYREVIGMHLCPDSHLCYICCHFLNKMCLFKSICLKRSLEYPVLFSEKGTINLQKSDTQVAILCPEDFCIQHLNSRYHFHNTNDNSQSDNDNEYVQLHHESHNDNGTHNHNDNDDFHKDNYIPNNDNNHNDNYILKNDNFLNNILPLTENKEVEYNHTDGSTQIYDISSNIIDTENEIFCKKPDQIIPKVIDSKHINENNERIKQLCNNDEMKNQTSELISYNNVKNDQQTNYQELETQNNDNYNSPEYNHNDITDNDYIDNDDNCNDPTESLSEDESIDVNFKKNQFEKIILSVEEQKKELENNRRSKKYIESDFKCHSCAMGFLFKDSYQAHMMRHEESNGEHRCSVCGLRFASVAVLRAHAANHYARYRCTACDVIVRYRQARAHGATCAGRRGRRAACHLCGKVFPSVSHFQQHLKRFHQSNKSSRVYPCNQCGKTFNNQAAAKTHMLTHVNKKFTCEICHSVCSSPYILNQHKKKHTSAELHHCTECKISFRSRKYLLSHLRRALAHKDSVYKCTVCTKICPSLDSLQAHISAVHERSKHLACDVCPARYSTRKGLLRHMLSHKRAEQKLTPLCHVCGEKFKSTNSLKRHLKNVCEKDKIDEIICDFYGE